jgi:hypothetical protein
VYHVEVLSAYERVVSGSRREAMTRTLSDHVGRDDEVAEEVLGLTESYVFLGLTTQGVRGKIR